jgi:hypothetical protein
VNILETRTQSDLQIRKRALSLNIAKFPDELHSVQRLESLIMCLVVILG